MAVSNAAFERPNGRIIVLGGGVAGLAASLTLGDVPLFEANDSVGGVAGTKCVDGFHFDHGIHVLQTEHPSIHRLFSELGIRLRSQRRVAMIYSHGVYTAYPFQINTAGLPLGLRTRCVWKFISRKRHRSRSDNYRDWIYENVGEGFGDKFLIPYSEKFWTIPPDEMTSEWTGNRIPPTSISHVLRGAVISKQTKVGTNAVFEYPDHGSGFGAIPNKMSKALTNVNLNHRATRIDTDNRRVTFNGGAYSRSYETIISTIPLPELVRIIPHAPRNVVEAAGRLRTNSIVVVNIGVANPNLSNRHWIHFPEKDVSFFRISYPQNLGAGLVPEGMSSVSAEVAYSKENPIDKSSIVERVKDDLIRTGSMGSADRVVLEDVVDIPYGYVIYDKYRRDAVRVIHDWLRKVGIHATGRYGLWAYLWSHEAILAGTNVAKRVGRKAEPQNQPGSMTSL